MNYALKDMATDWVICFPADVIWWENPDFRGYTDRMDNGDQLTLFNMATYEKHIITKGFKYRPGGWRSLLGVRKKVKRGRETLELINDIAYQIRLMEGYK